MRKFLVMMLAVLALVGCSKPKKQLRVSLFAELDIVNIMKARIAGFEKETGISVDAMYIPYASYRERIIAELSAHHAPDVIWIETGNFIAMQGQGAFQPLDEYAAKEQYDSKDFYPQMLHRFTVDGHLYALPQDTAPIACVYYNKAMFKKAGLSVPREDWTWDEFLEYCKKLTVKGPDGKVVTWGFKDNYVPMWDGIIYSNGGSLVDNVDKPTRCTLDLPQNIEAIEFLADMMLRYKVTPAPGDKSSLLSTGQDDFAAGHVAMIRTGIWITPALKKIKDFEWDIIPFPRGPRAKHPAWPTGGSGYAVSRDAKDPAKAWKLAAYLASAESMEAYAATGFVQPARISQAEKGAFLKTTPPANKKFLLKAPEYAVYDPADPHWPEIVNGTIQPEMDKIWLGDSKPAEALKRLTNTINARYYKAAK